jgi:hypothetical protein
LIEKSLEFAIEIKKNTRRFQTPTDLKETKIQNGLILKRLMKTVVAYINSKK